MGQGLLSCLLLVSVVEKAADTQFPSRPEDVGRHRHVYLVTLTVGQAHLPGARALGGAGPGPHSGQVVAEAVPVAGGDEEFGHRSPEHLGPRPAEEQLGLAVPFGQDRLAVGLHEGVA